MVALLGVMAMLTRTALVTVTRVAGSSGRMTVNYTTADITNTIPGDIPAVAGVDYTPVFGTLVFDDHEMSKKIYVQVSPNLPLPPDGLLAKSNRNFAVDAYAMKTTRAGPNGKRLTGDDTTLQLALQALGQLDGKTAKPADYRAAILAGMKLGDKGGQLAVNLLQKWTGEPHKKGRDLAAALAYYREWYAEKNPNLPPIELASTRLQSSSVPIRLIARSTLSTLPGRP